ncbi:hypothetical protein ACFL20_02810 [Spirochaetota bacterium]
MSNEHISFDKMSDLFDDIFAAEDKESILDHIDSCPQCKSEYNMLRKTLGYLSILRNQEINLKGFSGKTISAIKFKRKRFMIYKTLPAIAALFLIVFGVGIFKYGMFDISNRGNQIVSNDNGSVISDTEKIINIVRENKGRILRTDPFVEGEVPIEKFNMLKRVLIHKGFNKIRYGVVSHSSSNRRTYSRGTRNIEEVVVTNKNNKLYDNSVNSNSKKKFVRFRIFK